MRDNMHPRIPSATYRLQFHAGFTFQEARGILDYLDELGISDVYASPYFQASPTSTHGYDVADHNRINPAIGDDSDFRAYTSELRQRGLGQILDFVPNHMGIGESLNHWWMEVLEDGTASPYASYFDIDWHPSKKALAERVLLPILGDRYGIVLEKGELKLRYEEGAFFLDYFETSLPINPRSYSVILRLTLERLNGGAREKLDAVIAAFGALWTEQDQAQGKIAAKKQLADLTERETEVGRAIQEVLATFDGKVGEPASFNALHDLLEVQAYRLSYWRVAAEEINYRRFFDINTLAAIRVEIPEVFEAAHQFVFELLARGEVTGLRIDHVDGLWNPKEYLGRLQKRYAQLCGLAEDTPTGLYLLVEKILDLTNERLPLDWPVHGTTGYEFANLIVQSLVDARAEKAMTRIYQRFTGLTQGFGDLIYEKKKLTMQISLRSEIAALGRMLDELSELHRHYRDLTGNTLTYAVGEVMACFPVYRTYATVDAGMSAADEKVILRAIIAARRRNPTIEKSVFDFLRNLLLLRLPENLTPEQKEAHLRVVLKFQQCSGPVMAKGLEDTSFYIYNRLAALNEVGGNPGVFGLELAEFHRLNGERRADFPHTLLATSTHDTKRSEDVRMRLAAISEIPDSWQKALKQWSKLNRKHRTRIEKEHAPSANEEYLLYQTLLGTWPLAAMNGEAAAEYAGRIKQYMLKALKEAKVNSSWTEPNEEWEKAMEKFIDKILDAQVSGAFLAELSHLAEKIALAGATNSLTQTILKCTLPGVPDFYQGSEIWDFSLVDPDNRRPVDYAERRRLLTTLEGTGLGELMQDWKSGRIKLDLTRRLLRFRKEHAEFFREADYQAVEVNGTLARQVLAFTRTWNGQRLLVVAPRLTAKLAFNPTGGTWKDTALNWNGGEKAWSDLLTGRSISLPGENQAVGEMLSEISFGVFFQEG